MLGMDAWGQVPFPLLGGVLPSPLENRYPLLGLHFWDLLALLLPLRAAGREALAKQSMPLVLDCSYPMLDPSLASCGAVGSCANPHYRDVLSKCPTCTEQVTLCSTCTSPGPPQLKKGLGADRVWMTVTGRWWAG